MGSQVTTALELECRLRFITLCSANVGRQALAGLDLYVEGFWAGVESARSPRSIVQLEAALGAARAKNVIEQSADALQMVRDAGLEVPHAHP
jgi:hypothetical protein